MPSTQAISAKNLSCTRGDKLLFENLNFSIVSGECLHVTGENGSGKTSLLRIIAGINRSETGELVWNNENALVNLSFFAACAYIAHKDGLKNELTAIENLRYYQQLESNNSNSDQNEEALDEALDRLKILQCADLSAQQLSFGQRRRLAFARLLVSNFSLWILDEPFTGIDKNGRALIEELCVEHLEKGGVIILTHHQSLIDSPINAYRKELKLSELDGS